MLPVCFFNLQENRLHPGISHFTDLCRWLHEGSPCHLSGLGIQHHDPSGSLAQMEGNTTSELAAAAMSIHQTKHFQPLPVLEVF